jgi:3-hydroxybutyryl-CoA dehydrogenase
MEIKKVSVIGAGTIGHGIARLFMFSGFEVNLMDSDSVVLEKALQAIKLNVETYFVGRGKMSEADAKAMLNHLQDVSKLEDAVAESDLVVEVISENLDLKKKVFSELDQLCPSHAILASNTSSLSITAIASATTRAESVIGMHFFNPPDVFRLLEVVPGLSTSEETVTTVIDLANRMKMVTLRVKDTPGFVINRFIGALFSEAALLVQNGIASAETIDTGMRTAFGMRFGPCELMDYSGLELMTSTLKLSPNYTDIYLIERMVEAGRYGIKNGKGFYDYLPDGTKKSADLSNIAGS